MNGQTIRQHAERIIHRSELRDANESIVRVANLDDARAIIDALDNADSVFDEDGSCVMPRLREIPDPDAEVSL